MYAPQRSLMALVCATFAAMTIVAIASIYVQTDDAGDVAKRQPLIIVASAGKADRLALPEFIITVAREGKADGHFRSVALQAINAVDVSNANRLARAADPAVRKEKPPVVLDVAAKTVADETSPSEGDTLVIEPVANEGGAETNISEEPRDQSSRSDTPWDYPREMFEQAGERAQVLWDILFGTD